MSQASAASKGVRNESERDRYNRKAWPSIALAVGTTTPLAVTVRTFDLLRRVVNGGSVMGRPIEPATAAAESQDGEGDGGGRGDLLRRSFGNVTVSDRGL